MRYLACWLLLAALPALAAEVPSAKVIKVLPQFLDREGKHTTAPSLYVRDAYQAQLRKFPDQRSGLRFMVQWKGRHVSTLTLRVEMRGLLGSKATTATLEKEVKKSGWFSVWSEVALTGEEYKKFGEMTAWRVSLRDGNRDLAEQLSYLW